ncbi:transcriptional regulator [Kosakonia radicincitans]|uniref:transcriptional regulator n=1 Tax=Kosakonia radicincitans TaxID=283686 RepID=UPI000568609C|nr:YdaS family helix-turn-helix protein [Kosakonia radicincitans]
MTALDHAIRTAGSANRLATAIGVSGMAISQWKKNNGVVPASRVLKVFSVTGVTPHELRPDLYPNPTDGIPQLPETAACKPQ